ncbi:ubiquitin carboxyl-terminal hydrolase 5 [Hyaloraphidium curvatum]|nr:ubiquitin carboxyl-terminal hydrolase 5 [Hyaloraphidium curvatum]
MELDREVRDVNSPMPIDNDDRAQSDIVGSAPAADHVPAPVEPTFADVLPDAQQYYEPGDVEAEEVQKFPIQNWSEMRKGEDRQYTGEFSVGGATWRLLIFPKGNRQQESLSVFLECLDARTPEKLPDRWHKCVHFGLGVANSEDNAVQKHQHAHHRYSVKESDWGFNQMIKFADLTVPNAPSNRPILENDCFTLVAYVRVIKDVNGTLWHDLADWDSKKETGYVGLKNQGATCYMNSLLQSLYFTNYFRKATYQIPSADDSPTNSVPLALQRVFYNLQFSEQPVDTRELTKSFGWNTLDSFMQHDVQEFNRVLQDNLENKMKGTQAEGSIAKLFVGKMKSYIKCVDVDFESSRVEDYYDIQLNVKGFRNLQESFANYIQVEMLDGDNKYQAEGHGLQDARKGVIFQSFPPVLHLQLKRFDYDMQRDAMVKINDRFEFPDKIDLKGFMSEDAEPGDYVYHCHGVLVHSGDVHGGHYSAFIKPEKDGRWYKFDDDKVTPVAIKDVYEENFGGESPHLRPGMKPTKRFTNAYMLVYIRESEMDNMLSPVTESDIPPHLGTRIVEEKAREEKERKEREEQHLYMVVKTLRDVDIAAHRGFDLCNYDEKVAPVTPMLQQRVLKEWTFGDFKRNLATEFQIPVERMRLWSMAGRANKTIRPDMPISDAEDDRKMDQIKDKVARNYPDLRLYLEISNEEMQGPDGKVTYFLPREESNPHRSLLIFLKHYDPTKGTIDYAGHLTVKSKHLKIQDIIPMIQQRMKWEPDTNVRLFEEVKPEMIDPLTKLKQTFDAAEIGDGDILCFQKELTEQELANLPPGSFPTVKEYFDFLQNRIVVQFKPKDAEVRLPDDLGSGEFELELGRRMTYDAVAEKVAQRLGADPLKLRFSIQPSPSGINRDRTVIRRAPASTLASMLQTSYAPQASNVMFYEILDIPITELESKRYVRVTFLDPHLKEQGTHELLVPKNGTVTDVLDALRPKVKLEEGGTGQLRLFEVLGGRVSREFGPEDPVKDFADGPILYAEEVEQGAAPGDRTIRVQHFHKDPTRYHGIPFRLRLREGEPFSETRKRLQARMGAQDKDVAKMKFILLPTTSWDKPVPIEDDTVLSQMELKDEDIIGIDHPDKNASRSRFGFEKSIRILG